MTTEDTAAVTQDPLTDQPHAIVERDGVRYTLLGTAHVSRASVDTVRNAIASGAYDTIAVELDPQRLAALTDPDALGKLDLVKVLREGKAALFAANLGLAAYQRRLAEQLGIEPGAELKAAAIDARERGLALHLIDRDVGITFKRASSKLGWWGRAKLVGGLATALFVDDEVGEEEIEKLKQGDLLEASFGEFAAHSPELFDAVIAERDRYMAARLRESATHASGAREVLAVVGAGHLQGLATFLRDDTRDPVATREELDTAHKKSSIPWFTIILTALLLGGLAWGFWHGGLKVGTDLLLQWIAITAGLAAVGCALAGGHPLSILAPDGRTVPLLSMVDVSVLPAATAIRRVNRQTALTITAKLPDKVTMPEARKAMEGALKSIAFPAGYSYTFEGSAFGDEDDAMKQMMFNLVIALVMIYIVMSAVFESLLFPAAIMSGVLFSIFGVFWLFWLTGTEFNIMAFIGILVLMGVVVNNGIVMIEHINNLRRRGMSRTDALVEGSRERLRPILMTMGTAILAMVPIALQTSEASNNMPAYYPMARAIAGGLAFSTIVSLLFLPTIYAMLDDMRHATSRVLAKARGMRRDGGVAGATVAAIAVE